MALKDAYVLKEDRAIGGAQWPTQALSPFDQQDHATTSNQAYSPTAIPPEAKPPDDPEHYGPLIPVTVQLSYEDWNYLEDIVGSAVGQFGDDEERVINILHAIRKGTQGHFK